MHWLYATLQSQYDFGDNVHVNVLNFLSALQETLPEHEERKVDLQLYGRVRKRPRYRTAQDCIPATQFLPGQLIKKRRFGCVRPRSTEAQGRS